MAATRKLQAEIDRCLKKVAEGVEKFEETWQKVHNASNSNQKEKYEEDLKKEIKKLQRLRDQIKTWIASAEIKDKSVLMDKRKLIEMQMERFKVVERETKTKAYSKEGLTSGTKLDPAEKERYEISQWLNNCLDNLNIQIDQFEAEIEVLQTAKKKKNKNEHSDKIDEYTGLLERHRDHVQKLETILRMLDNKTVEISQIRDIKDDVEYYIDNCMEPDFMENDTLYEEIDGLEEMLLEVKNAIINGPEHNKENSLENASETMSTNSASSPVPFVSMSMHNHSNDQNDNDKRRHKSSSDDSKGGSQSSSTKGSVAASAAKPASSSSSSTSSSTSTPALTSTSTAVTTTMTESTETSNSTAVAVNNHVSSSQVVHPPTLTLASLQSQPNNSLSNSKALQSSIPTLTSAAAAVVAGTKVVGYSTSSTTPTPTPTSTSNGTMSPVMTSLQNFASAVLNGHASTMSEIGNRGSTTPTPSPAAPTTSIPFSQAVGNNSIGLTSMSQTWDSPIEFRESNFHQSDSVRAGLADVLPSLKSIAQKATDEAGLKIPTTGDHTTANISHQGLFHSSQPKDRSPKTEAHIPPLLGVAPLGPVPLTKETQLQYQMLESAYLHMPHPSDSERLRPYLPRNPCSTPHYYPQLPPQGSDSIEFFQRLSTETLFFIFYYMEGTKAQYLAAKALKKQSWRFHTKYMMWFQRHEEPKIINDEYEQGTYIYFDFEKWGQRKKEGFTFEYRFLEDRELN